MNNPRFWARHIRDAFVPQIRALRHTYEERIVPAFEDIDEEADEVAEQEWRRLGRGAGPNADPADLAETAREKGVDYYLTAQDTLQGITNLMTVGLRHLVEQQMLLFLRKALLRRAEAGNPDLFRAPVFLNRLAAEGVRAEEFESWPVLEELRHVSNAVKHADGEAVDELREIRPEAFRRPDPVVQDVFGDRPVRNRPVYQPLFGQELYVTDERLHEYFDAALEFWDELATALEAHD